MNTLVLLRHGKSGYPPDVDDHDRPLDARGEREAPVAGRLLARSDALRVDNREDNPEQPSARVDLVLVSTAHRAQQTWAMVAPELPDTGKVETLEALYLASAADLLNLLHEVPDSPRRVLVVGHNDGLEELASSLSNTDVRLKTSTFAVLTSRRPWHQWSEGTASLVEVVVAR